MDDQNAQKSEMNVEELQIQREQDGFVIEQLATENANLKIQNIRMGHLLSKLTQEQENA